MAVQRSIPVRNAMLEAAETVIGSAAKLQLRSGAPPASCAAADIGAMIVELTLPADWSAAASNGTKTWAAIAQVNAVASAIIGHYRLKDSTGAVCHEQGTVGMLGEGADVTADNTDVKAGQAVGVTGWTLTMPGA